MYFIILRREVLSWCYLIEAVWLPPKKLPAQQSVCGVEANRNRPKFDIFHAHCAPHHIHRTLFQAAKSSAFFKCWKIWTFNFKQSLDNFLCKSRRCQNSQWNRQYFCLLHKLLMPLCYFFRFSSVRLQWLSIVEFSNQHFFFLLSLFHVIFHHTTIRSTSEK